MENQAVDKYLKNDHGLETTDDLSGNFSLLKKWNGKLDSLIYEVLFIQENKPRLNTQSDSIRAKLFNIFSAFSFTRSNMSLLFSRLVMSLQTAYMYVFVSVSCFFFRFQYLPWNDRTCICCIRDIPNLFPNVPWNRWVWPYSRSVHFACLYVFAVLGADCYQISLSESERGTT